MEWTVWVFLMLMIGGPVLVIVMEAWQPTWWRRRTGYEIPVRQVDGPWEYGEYGQPDGSTLFRPFRHNLRTGETQILAAGGRYLPSNKDIRFFLCLNCGQHCWCDAAVERIPCPCDEWLEPV